MGSEPEEHADSVVIGSAAGQQPDAVGEADFAVLVVPHLGVMTGLAGRLAGPAGCYAVAERALALAWRQRGTLAGGPGGVRGRLVVMVADCAWRKDARWWRRAVRRVAQAGTGDRGARRRLTEIVSGYEADIEVADALERLPRRQRLVVELRYYLDQGVSEIAEITGGGPAGVREVLAGAIGQIAGRLGVSAGSAGQRLGEDAGRWQSRQPPAVQADAQRFSDALTRVRGHRFRRFPVLIAGAAGGIVAAAVWTLTAPGSPPPAGGSAWPAPIPLASSHPLRTAGLAPTRLIVVEQRHQHSLSWKLKAEVREYKPRSGNGFSGPGICLGVDYSFKGSLLCPGLISSLYWNYAGAENGGVPAGTVLAYGVTSTSAARVVFTFAGTTHTVTTPTVSAPEFPGLRFFSVLIPAGYQTAAGAIAANGKPIERTGSALILTGRLSPQCSTTFQCGTTAPSRGSSGS